MSKYEPLRRFLEANPREGLDLSFEKIEKILGFRLPRSAHEHAAAWWSNEHSTHAQARAWMDAGWQVWRVHRSEKKVRFEPREKEPEAAHVGVSDVATPFIEDARVIAVRESSLRGSAIRLLEDYREANGGTIADSIAAILNGMAVERRRQLLERFPLTSNRSALDSTDLIREDRDAR